MLPLQAAVAAVYTLNPVQALYLTAGRGPVPALPGLWFTYCLMRKTARQMRISLKNRRQL